MKVHDLARDDDFLSHLLVEKLGTGDIPLLVHKMDPSRRLPKTNPTDLMAIIRRLVSTKGSSVTAIHDAVDHLLELPSVRYFTKGFTEREINSFATHASRYMELYLPSGSIEIAHTQRYSHHTGKSELCILATRALAPGTVLSELKGSMADLTESDELELKRTDRRNSQGGSRRDFSVIHSKQLKKNHLFLGPARFVNHDCDNNCELFREGRYITFRVVKPVAVGEEVTAHYGDGYFGRGNRDCLCETCEKRGMGGYGPPMQLPDDGRSDESSDLELPEKDGHELAVNVNERRTRRGVYAVLKESDAEPAEDTEAEPDSTTPGGAIDLKREVEAAETEPDALSTDPNSIPPSRSSLIPPNPIRGLATPESDSASASGGASSRHRSLKPGEPSVSASPAPSTARSVTPTFEPIITTRRQKKARELQQRQQLVTPPLSEDTASLAESASAPAHSTPASRGRGKGVATGEPDRALSASTSTSTSKQMTKAAEEDARNKDKGMDKTPAQEADSGKKGKISDPTVPTCVTCLSVLPIISLDRTIVYGDFTTGKGKKEKHECPRCLRHYAIYGIQWPHRTSAQVVNMPTPRESTPAEPTPRPNTHKLLHAVGKKLAATATSTSAPPPVTKRKRQESPPAAVTSKHKRRKTLSSIPLPAAHPRELIRKGWSRSGRKHLPSAKVREIEPIQSQKRPRGRPRIHPLPSSARPTSPITSSSSSAPASSPTAVASAPPALPFGAPIVPISFPLRTAKSRAVDDQPREINGRFGKKAGTNGKFRRHLGPSPMLRRTRAQRAEGRAAAQREAAAGASFALGAATAVKRERDYEEDEHEHASDTYGSEESVKRSRVSSGFGFVHTQYFSPNPMSFARKKWAPARPPPPPTHHLRSLGALPYQDPDVRVTHSPASSSASAPPMSSQLSPTPLPSLLVESEELEDETDGGESDDGDLPVTPENMTGPEPDSQADAEFESEDNELPTSGGSTNHPLPTLWKPSPFAFAARRWAVHEGGGRQYEHDRERNEGLAASGGTGTATDVSAGFGGTSCATGVGARGGNTSGGIARAEWMQVNGTAAEFRQWDTYEVESGSSSEEEDVVVLKSPDPTKFKLANALFPGIPVRPPSSTNNAVALGQSESAAVEPASTTPSPVPPQAIPVAPLVFLKGAQYGIPGMASKFPPPHMHSPPPGLVEAGWDSEASAEA
ncbi:hypothetical protein F5148DRAFT_1282652 [Russula earlei]|uniref:Uncharacterized protein n=1 Tax=Russula earlei TaxID=71964 RepID=A0ACC0UDB7_9AGAM|nr:hypothetical protein F5148DRAFT_1282652 [Russula earlei]